MSIRANEALIPAEPPTATNVSTSDLAQFCKEVLGVDIRTVIEITMDSTNVTVTQLIRVGDHSVRPTYRTTSIPVKYEW